ncbi:MAG: OmpH family outer membrane protein [Acidiferrobacterales bacterium]|nr:OmpH family outer membrane protein [Acidiferrobacterales bacterium]
MLKRSLFILVALSALLVSGTSYAQLKIGVYDNRAILDNLPSVQKELDKLKTEFEPSQKKIKDLESKLVSLQEDIEKNQEILSAGDLQAKQLEFQSMRREYQLLAEDTERVFTVRRNEVVQKLQASIEQEVLKLAKEQSYDLILRSGILYASPTVDITQEVLKRLSTQ